MPEILYDRPWMYQKQQDALFCPERFAIVEASTKTGKSIGSMVWLFEQAIKQIDGYGRPLRREQVPVYWWLSPVYPQARIIFRRMQRAIPKDLYVANASEMTMTLRNGSIIFFKSAENPDNLYGEDVMAVVVDEATRVREESWTAVRSTLTATRGPARIIGNVKGKKNWVYRLGQVARGGQPGYHYAKLTAWDAVEAGVLAREEVEDAQATLPPHVFAELYLAEPTDDGANPFDLRAIEECSVDVPLGLYGDPNYAAAGLFGPAYAWGWDLARGKAPGSDWTVGIGLNQGGDTVGFDRFQGPWHSQILRIRSNTGTVSALVDSTGAGDAPVEELQVGGGNFNGYKFSSQSKQVLMEGLAIRLQQRRLRIPRGIITDELETFEYQYKPGGRVTYSAPVGFHDDCVMALALAVHQMGDGSGPRLRWI